MTNINRLIKEYNNIRNGIRPYNMTNKQASIRRKEIVDYVWPILPNSYKWGKYIIVKSHISKPDFPDKYLTFYTKKSYDNMKSYLDRRVHISHSDKNK